MHFKEFVMKCYRNGGCGPYEMYSCSECPCSKEEYLLRKIKKEIDEQAQRMAQECIDIIKTNLNNH